MPDSTPPFQRAYFLISLIPVLYFFNLPKAEVASTQIQPIFRTAAMGCEGTLGDNLFEDGDFGSGTVNIPPQDPGIAPGYNYINFGPPYDGQYVITNHTGAWPGLYPTWIKIRDNSTDPNGYMMVVNADFSPGVFYEQEIKGLCANTTFEFTADVINLISKPTTGHIRPNISFFINDELKFTSGDIDQDETWKTFGFTFTTGPTNTDLVLSIRNNAPGGIGNDLALDNITFRACGPEAVIEPLEETVVCLDDDSLRLSGRILDASYPEAFIQWQVSDNEGANYTDIPGATRETYTITNFASGSYLYRFVIASTPENLNNTKCRVFSIPKRVTVYPKVYNIKDTICSGLTYETPQGSYAQSGIYTDTLISSFGCDSIVTLDLTVINDPRIEADILSRDPSCFGFSDASITLEILRAGFPPYTYSINEDMGSSSHAFTGLPAGDYQVKIRDRFGCFFEENISLFDPSELTLDLGESINVPLGIVHSLQSYSSYNQLTYQWNAPFEMSCTDCPEPNVLARENGVISLQVINATGCVATDSVQFSINTAESYKIYAPNAFSPNGDGINDQFTVFSNGLEVEEIEIFQIYDRWGNLLFDQAGMPAGDTGQGWNGLYKNQIVDMGVYIYRLEVRFIDGIKKTFTGSVTLIR